MTATATRERTDPPPLPTLAGTATLVRFKLRRDRVRLPAWTAGLAVFALYLITAIPAVYGTGEELQRAVGPMLGDPMGRLLIGPAYGFDELTAELFIIGGYGLYFLILVALMSILLVSRHTRVEEQTGREELIRANVVGRHAPLIAALIVTVITNLVVAAATVGVMLTFGYTPNGVLVFGASMVAVGLAFAGLTATTVQLAESSRPASGMAGAVLGLSFLVRGIGDAAEVGGTWVSWLSPLGWAQQTAPFALDRWWPLLLLLVLAGVGAAVGFALSTRRDVGSGLWETRPGPANAADWVRSGPTLWLRLQRSLLGWWVLVAVVLGVSYGAFTETMVQALTDLPPEIVELMGGTEQAAGGYLGFMAFFQALAVSIFALLATQSLRNEESSGRAEPVLATPTSRVSWMGGNLAVTAVGIVGLLAIIGVTTGISAAAVTGDAGLVRSATIGHVVQAPAVLVVLGVAALLYGIRAELTSAAWALLGYGLLAGIFAELMDLPGWVAGISPFEHPPRMPLEDFALLPTVLLTVVAAALAFGGLVCFRRRGINA